MVLFRKLALIAVAALMLGCAGPAKEADGTPTGPNPILKTVSFKIGPATIQAEVALTSDQREKGLMFRKSLSDGRGMLFVFEQDQTVSFWMKNTDLPLSIAWIGSDGRIKGISELRPRSLDPVSSERSIRYALEVPSGWFERAGVRVGDNVELPPLD